MSVLSTPFIFKTSFLLGTSFNAFERNYQLLLFCVTVAAIPRSKKHMSCTADVVRQTKIEKKT